MNYYEVKSFVIRTFMRFRKIRTVRLTYILTILPIHQEYIYCGILRWDSFSAKPVSNVSRNGQIEKNVARFPQ